MTPVDWELDKLGLDIRDGLRLYNPDPDGHCQLTVDGEYDFNVPYQGLKQFVERVERESIKGHLNLFEYLGDSISAGMDELFCLHIVEEYSDGTQKQLVLDPEVFGNLLSYLMALPPVGKPR